MVEERAGTTGTTVDSAEDNTLSAAVFLKLLPQNRNQFSKPYNQLRLIKPKPLNRGDKIGIISPSGTIKGIEARFNRGVEILKKLGFEVVLGASVFKSIWHMAGTDRERADDFNSMFADDEIKAVFCSRGGESAMRILDHIDYDLVGRNPKILMGMSDISVLLNAVLRKASLVTFHGPNVSYGINCEKYGFPDMVEYSRMSLIDSLTGEGFTGEVKYLFEPRVIRKGSAVGHLIGGNLDCIEKLSGTEFEPDFDGAILLLEEIDESTAEMERDIMPLKLRGLLSKLNGIVVGHLEKCFSSRADEEFFYQTLAELTEDYGYPILKIEEFGHHAYNCILPLGVMAKIENEKLILLESGIERSG